MIGYGVMSFLMTATPLAMKHHHFEFSDWRSVIQWHVLGMFLPSFATGFVIKRIGVLNVLWIGAAVLFVAVAADLSGLGFWNFWAGLALLGVGWNFLYVGGSTLLTEGYQTAERSKVQGLNDFLIFGTVASSSFASGTLHNAFGWTAVNFGVLPLVALTLGATLWLMGPAPAGGRGRIGARRQRFGRLTARLRMGCAAGTHLAFSAPLSHRSGGQPGRGLRICAHLLPNKRNVS